MNTLSATISVTLNGLSKGVRERLQDKNWQVRESAETEAAEAIRLAIERGFEVRLKPMTMPSRYPTVSEGDANG